MQNKQEKIVANNKSAYHNYFVEEVIECGIVLTGTEIKSIRSGKVSINDSYCDFKDNEMFIINMHISLYDKGNIFNHNPLRDRKLLLHREEITKLNAKITQKGLTLIPLKLYFKQALIKMELGLCQGKHTYDKKRSLMEKDIKRENERQLKNYR